MIRARAPKKPKRFAKLFTAVVPPDNLPVIRTAGGKFKRPGEIVPSTCACGESWSVAFPGQTAWVGRRINDQGMVCVEPPIARRDNLYLCLACARDRGWPNLSSETDTIRGNHDEPATDVLSTTSSAADDQDAEQTDEANDR